ncbi:potassium channel subfamily K member 18-like protein [Dinothrombium tinctorium]|uniref:Potassium channel subfamily K member 18-like protein n=1 Tax=Dinothrombium tinctorium TaxID=1965070 RepID=A0A3S3S7J0_9ACAR|nr:potassium channel subfamily K member 18-like protein [Dinothrombium tinctorium]RWS11554.1 potassium channel subfamily K member 18-like protein [Dinothrombium tinctorium]RWS11685.1 potassium channel subfamily K member 18-like protein [Dinothrombium tinctorium]RWS11720.1 potassium channel subfamily K member 18-like protein [Dinothrombium tinctorium]
MFIKRYGNIAPKTNEGKVATIVYAIIGIPIMLLFLTNTGNFFANAFRYVYRTCCGCSNGNNTDHSSANLHAHHSHHHLHDHYHVHHIALNDVGPNQGHVMLQCNSSNADPYRNKPCYTPASVCNAANQRDQYGTITGGVPTGCINEAETKICQGTDHHTCTGTLGRAHSHSTPHSTLLRSDRHHHHSDHINAEMGVGGPVTPFPNNSVHDYQERKKKVAVPVLLCMLLINGYISLGACFLYFTEGWTFLDGSYFCFLTLSTIGFGNLTPGNSVLDGSEKKLIFFSAYLLGGMALIAMCFNLVQDQVVFKFRRCKKTFGLVSDESDDDEEEAANALQNTNNMVENHEDFDV